MDGNIKAAIGLTGGVILLYFAFSTFEGNDNKPLRGLIAGVALSSLNPYFIVWWLTVGFTLAIQASYFGTIGLIVLVIFHESCDFVWYGFVSFASYKGMRFKKAEKTILAVSFLIMVFFGLYFIYDGIKSILS